MTELTSQLHCGACQTPFDECDELKVHLETCGAAKAFILPVTYFGLGGKDSTHKISHLINASSKYADYIREYAKVVSNDQVDSYLRSSVHRRLCDKLGLEYSEFRPFESSNITEMPTQEEAEKIIWDAIAEILRKLVIKDSGVTLKGMV